MTFHELRDGVDRILTQIQELERLLRIAQKKETIAQLVEQSGMPSFWNNPEEAKRQSQVLNGLQTTVQRWETMVADAQDIDGFLTLEGESMSEDVQMQLSKQYQDLQQRYDDLSFQTLLSGKYDDHNAIVSIHAGAGGTEAQDWASMLLRMIMRYSESKGWRVTLLDESKGQEAGIKSVTLRIEGSYAYGYIQSEHGTHRLVRISPFDAESMRHTSFANIEVIPEMEAQEAVTIDPKDVRIDTFLASGKGGQSVNTTYSAVRVVHLPTGIAVSCQNERSQQQNKETAFKILQSKLQVLQDQEEEKQRQQLRGEVKSAEWGNQIRSYVLHPYKMVKDLRTKKESTNPEEVLNGELDDFMRAYLRWKKEGQIT